MKLSKSFAVAIFLATLFSASCGKTAAPPASSSAGALTANSSLNSAPPRPFGRHALNSAGAIYLNDFIRPEVRARLDEEPTGDVDGGFDPSASEPGTAAGEPADESGGETQNEEAGQPHTGVNEDGPGGGPRIDTLKFSWAKKAFGDAVKASPTNHGIIVVYADENYYDIERLMPFVEEGRNRIAENSALPGDRLQVVFGGYRATPQVELWIVPEGGPVPEFKTEERPKAAQPEG